MKPIRIERLLDPMGTLMHGLRQRYPDEGIRAVGIGQRRVDGALSAEPAIKVLLQDAARTDRDGLQCTKLPERVPIETTIFGRPVSFAPTLDVEPAPRAATTWFAVEVGDRYSQAPAAYASWFKGNGHRGVGIVTAGHGLWRADHSRPLRSAAVDLGSEMLDCEVEAASHLLRDHVDIGLLEIPPSKVGEVELPRLPTAWRGASVLSAPELIALLGVRDDDRAVEVEFETAGLIATFESVAYFGEYSVDIAGWGLARLEGVIESDAARDTFVPGTSGAAIGHTSEPRAAAGIQSLCLDPDGPRQRSLATSFAHGVAWLRSRVGSHLILSWDPRHLGL